jgi:hypothetical protein
VAVLSLCSCQQLQSLRITEKEQPPRIAVGDSIDDAHRRIVAAGGKKIPIGAIATPPSFLSGYELKDGTGLEVTASPTGKPDRYVIECLTLGEPGRGYGGDKITWLKQQKHDVQFIDLE